MRTWLLRPLLCGYACEVEYTLDPTLEGAEREASEQLVGIRKKCPRHIGLSDAAIYAGIKAEGVKLNTVTGTIMNMPLAKPVCNEMDIASGARMIGSILTITLPEVDDDTKAMLQAAVGDMAQIL